MVIGGNKTAYRKIIARIKGGLGNQMFCYAAARRLSIVNNAELVIDHITGFKRDHKYKRKYELDKFNIQSRKATTLERMQPFERYRRALAKVFARRKAFQERRYIEREGLEFDERLLHLRVAGTIYLDGIWESERYFRDVEGIIRNDFRIIPPVDLLNQEMSETIRGCNAVAIHLRWFDLPGARNSQYNLPTSYYHGSIQKMRKEVIDPHFFLFSDDPNAARRVLELPNEIVTCVGHNQEDAIAYADLWLMSQCKHFIIANSMFSWWGAWLGENKKKIVIAPGLVHRGKTAWGFSGLIPSEWVTIEVS